MRLSKGSSIVDLKERCVDRISTSANTPSVTMTLLRKDAMSPSSSVALPATQSAAAMLYAAQSSLRICAGMNGLPIGIV